MLKLLGFGFLIIYSFVNVMPNHSQTAETVFIGFPEIKVSEGGLNRTPAKLIGKDAANLRCIISRIGDEYYWASRENVRLVKIDGGGAFTTFLATNGAGYVRIIKPHFKEAASLMSETEKNFDYIEHMTIGLSTLSYWGKQEH